MFIVIEIQTSADGTVGNFVWSFESRANAEAKYHAVLSAAAVSGLPCHAAVLLRNDGRQIAAQSYRVVPEPAPVPGPVTEEVE